MTGARSSMKLTRRSFVATVAGALGLLAAGVGSGIGPLLKPTPASASGTAWVTIPNYGYLHCTANSCHVAGTCRTTDECSPVYQEDEWKKYRNITGQSKTCWGNPTGPCGWKQCDGSAQTWMTYVGTHYCCYCQ